MKSIVALDQQSSDLTRAWAEEAGLTVEQYLGSAVNAFHYIAKPLMENRRIDIAIDGVVIISLTLREDTKEFE